MTERFNPNPKQPRLSMEQYQELLRRKQLAQEEGRRIRYKDLTKQWGVAQSVIGSAVSRGIKRYDYKLWKENKL